MKRNILITIERQYGSGGRTVGEMLSKQLGIPYYDKDLAKMASEDSGISENLFVSADETIKGMIPIKPAGGAYKGELAHPDDKDFTSKQNLFNIQAKVLKDLAASQSCVVVGRCANYVLRDFENVVSVFVHAPMDFLLEQAALKQSLRGKELEKYVIRTNQNRAAYYTYYTGQSWERALNYDLCLDSKKLGFDKCAEEIKAYMKVRYGADILD